MEAKRVLIIDDEAEIAALIQDFLQERGYEVRVTPNGRTGLEEALHHPPSLIILDVGLPDIQGYDVCRKIRGVSTLRNTPVIMLTSHTLETDEVKGFKAGADDYVAKPFKPAKLLARIQAALERNLRELDANALTHLPGNMVIMQEIKTRLLEKIPFSVLYMDLNNFKAFNDRYGFVRGDTAIKVTSNILLNCFTQYDFDKAFLGHVGGDDFIGILDSHQVVPLCDLIIEEFDKKIPSLYDEEDQKRGKITSTNRQGRSVEYPLMGLAIAVVTNKAKHFDHPGEIALIAGDLKKGVKTNSRSAYLIDRRA